MATYQEQTHAAVNTVAPIAATFYPPATVIQPVANTLIDSIFGIIAGISAVTAAYKNNQASKQKAAAAALASAVVTSPALNAVAIANSASNNSTAEVQKHLTSAASPT